MGRVAHILCQGEPERVTDPDIQPSIMAVGQGGALLTIKTGSSLLQLARLTWRQEQARVELTVAAATAAYRVDLAPPPPATAAAKGVQGS